MQIDLPYGRTHLTVTIPDHTPVDLIEPPEVTASNDPQAVVRDALADLIGGLRWADFADARSVAIAINDKTRPVPHRYLLPPLLDHLEGLGIPAEAITFYIAVGTHPPMWDDEFEAILPESILARYRVISHDSEDERLLVYLGETARGTPVWTSAAFYHSDFKIVVGNIEPHQFVGFSGGVKTAAIGLGGLKMINRHHAFLMQPESQLGEYDTNPARMDIEEIGGMINIHLALNAVLNQERQIVRALAGDPVAVMQAGIPLCREICQVAVPHKYSVMLASPGGHPKDINVYQSQKGMFHAARIIRPGGIMILAAACPEGAGSPHYADWMEGKGCYQEVMRRFEAEGFRIGPHKAFLIARDASKIRLHWHSEMDHQAAENLLLNPIDDFQAAVDAALADLQPGERVGILPHAASTIPYVKGQ